MMLECLIIILLIAKSGLFFGASVYLIYKNDSSDFWKGFYACGLGILGIPFVRFVFSFVKAFIGVE